MNNNGWQGHWTIVTAVKSRQKVGTNNRERGLLRGCQSKQKRKSEVDQRLNVLYKVPNGVATEEGIALEPGGLGMDKSNLRTVHQFGPCHVNPRVVAQRRRHPWRVPRTKGTDKGLLSKVTASNCGGFL